MEHWKLFLLGGLSGLGIYLIRRRMAGGVCRSLKMMESKTVIVTGASCGIGKETSKDLARRGARVIMACRDVKAGNKAAEEIRNKHKNVDVVVKELDLSSFSSIREFAQDIVQNEKRLDVLINNAGIYHCPYKFTSDQLEMQMGVNHLGHFLLTNLLLSKLKQTPSKPARVVVVSSGLSKYGTIDIENLNSQVGSADTFCIIFIVNYRN